MSDKLPSRDAVAEALTFAPLTTPRADPIYDIARAYVHGGRLVDREAIDYEALVAAVAPYIRADHPELDLRETIDTAIDSLLAAAIGDTDE